MVREVPAGRLQIDGVLMRDSLDRSIRYFVDERVPAAVTSCCGCPPRTESDRLRQIAAIVHGCHQPRPKGVATPRSVDNLAGLRNERAPRVAGPVLTTSLSVCHHTPSASNAG